MSELAAASQALRARRARTNSEADSGPNLDERCQRLLRAEASAEIGEDAHHRSHAGRLKSHGVFLIRAVRAKRRVDGLNSRHGLFDRCHALDHEPGSPQTVIAAVVSGDQVDPFVHTLFVGHEVEMPPGSSQVNVAKLPTYCGRTAFGRSLRRSRNRPVSDRPFEVEADRSASPSLRATWRATQNRETQTAIESAAATAARFMQMIEANRTEHEC